MTFDFNQDILLENERALLRPLQESDIIHLSPFAIHEPEIWTYSLVNAGSEAGMQEYISQALLGRVQKKNILLSFLIKKSNLMQVVPDSMIYVWKAVAFNWDLPGMAKNIRAEA